ncbi:MAG: hypothetical protein ACTHNH_18390 [Mesorhizobium sp.]
MDALAAPHPLGHQQSKANRYVLPTRGGSHIELMLEKNEGVPLNIWVEKRHATKFMGGTIPCRESPASGLWASMGKNGNPNYGRHSALEHMSALSNADLLCLAPRNLEELGKMLDHLVER